MSSANDPFEFLKSLWAPMGIAMPGMAAPTMDVDEIEKRIKELKLVEGWLSMNLNALRMTIQALEVQRSTLSAMRDGIAGAERLVQTAAGLGASERPVQAQDNAMNAWWAVLQQAQQQAAEQLRPKPQDGAKPDPDRKV